MMKRFFLSMMALAVAFGVYAQTVQEAYKDLMDGRVDKAQTSLEGLLAKDPASAEVNYWLGQVYITQGQLHRNSSWRDKAKEVYTKAMTSTNQNPLIVVAVGHIELLEGKTAEAMAHFDGAVLASATKKNKKYGDPVVLNAIVRANAGGDSKIGDVKYAETKAAQSEELMGATPDMFVSLGIVYLKGGGENGGPAKRAFEKAIALDPNFAPAYWRIGKIFESQKNPEMYLDFYEKAIKASDKFSLSYLSMYDHYKNRDVNKAKEYIELFIANADKDIETDYFYADYLFRAGKYQESLQKAKDIEASLSGEKFAKVNKLYSFNYDRLKDSVKAMEYMEKYLAQEDADKIEGEDYAYMAASYLKVPGNVVKAETMAEKAIGLDTSVAGKVIIMDGMANAYTTQQDWVGAYKWMARKQQVKPDNSARNLYFLSDAALKAKEFDACQSIASQYIASFPDQPQGYIFKSRAAIAADPDTSKGSAIPAIDEYTQFLMKDTVKNKGRIIQNHGYKVFYYLVKAQDYQKAIDAGNAILAIDPANAYGQMAISEAQRLLKANGGKATSAAGGNKPTAATGAGGSPGKFRP
ncbi:tetratricopeptide repeat protein [Phnomibacter ginsenosidimutans]|uniref:Tetratricopeptide repeat protein n=1 Tax=Phnomibacter ginsenosidimutans TaxID=2676868 RepID=A0A6I6GKC2_9BACT|nr:tetratricopeptide repeat protein [Phnomibacter ginsenosidimutans]QGW27352.1 tetratricopeptide repeat protein [Phnomibacter ginsenosidimutans]